MDNPVILVLAFLAFAIITFFCLIFVWQGALHIVYMTFGIGPGAIFTAKEPEHIEEFSASNEKKPPTARPGAADRGLSSG